MLSRVQQALNDCRFGLRMLRKHAASSVAAIISLGLAIGACTAAFALIDALIFRPLPVPGARQLISIAHVMPAFFSPDNQPRESDAFSYAQYELLRETARKDAELFAMGLSGGLQAVTFDDGQGAMESIRAESMSGRAFEILGIQAVMGRLIQPDDDQGNNAHPIAVLSEAFWRRRFGGSPGVLGHWVTLGRKQFQIAGVARGPFSGVQSGYLTDLWVPLIPAADARLISNPDAGWISVWGRIHDGIERSRLRDPLQAAYTNFVRERVGINPPRNLHGAALEQFIEAPLRVRDASSGRDSLFRSQFRRPLWILAMICALLLLIACSNVGNLMLARASARRSEMALRVSLGAARSRLVQQMLIESGQVAAASCVLALIFAALVAPLIVVRLGPTEFPAWLDVAPDARMFVFAVVLSFVTALLFGVVPAVRASSASPADALKEAETQHSGRIGSLRWMLVAQIGFSVAVLFLSGLLLISFRKLTSVDLGFVSQNVVLFDLAPRDPQAHRRNSGAQLLEHIRQVPGVESASLTQQRPIGGDMVWIMSPIIRWPGRATETVRPREVPVSAGFFEAMRIRRIAGRDFLPEEIASDSASVIVNQAFVNQYLRGRNPIGETFEKLSDNPEPMRQRIVGVVGNIRYNNLRETERPSIYTPLRDAAGATLNVRAGVNVAELSPRLRKEIELADPSLRVAGSILLSSQIDNTLIRERLLAFLAGFFSVVALLLAGIGLYGVVNYSAVRRTREIGIRIALGATWGSVVRLMVYDTALAVGAGAVVGVACGLGLARYLASQVFDVKPTDFWSVAAPLACIFAAAAIAVLPPAMRAAGADPMTALRHE
ncbi:MAG TPA: ABC transporter permease [Bryobacteraceae bacterium]|nr:ABC transporter permease [Bryobacteraceae bacterium]